MEGNTQDDLAVFGYLSRYVGARILAENLGEEEVFVELVLAGEAVLEEVHLDAMYDLLDMLQEVVGDELDDEEPVVEVEVRRGAGGTAVAVGPEDRVPLGVDLDGDGVADVTLAPMMAGSPGVGKVEEQEKKRVALRNARALAVMTMFRLGLTYEEQVAALGLVSQIELALIAFCRESVPEPGQTWDSHRRAREIERRLARLRWVEQEQAKERSGVKGVWNWLMGKKPLTGRALYEKFVEHADGMMRAMEEEREGDIITQAFRFTGSDRVAG